MNASGHNTDAATRVVFAGDINPLLAEAFLEEAPMHAARFTEAVTRLSGGSPSLDDVVQAQRVAHTLKGSANITGVIAIANLTHEAEDVLDWLASNHALPPDPLREVLIETADCVSAMVDALRGSGEAPPGSAAVLERLAAWRASVAPADDVPHGPRDSGSGAVFEHGRGPASEPAGTAIVMSTARPPAVDPLAFPSPEVPAAAGAGLAAPVQNTLRVSVGLVDRLLGLAGEFAVSNVQSQGAHQRMSAQANALREQHHLVQQRLADLQDLVEIRGVPSGGRAGAGAPVVASSAQGFDPLELDEYNELHGKTTALAEAMTDFCELALGLRPELARMDDTIVDQQRISKELSDAVMSARMVPVGSIVSRLERAVRETCRATGKHAALQVIGGDIPVDGDVLNALVDPLLHTLRNAVDHGLESAEEREAAGKSAGGSLEVAFTREGDNVKVRVSDDGRGFDVARIRAVAEARGVLSPGDVRTDRELLQLSVRPGFTTREVANQVSGRGIGMDVVHKAVLDLKGTLDIVSHKGRGASVTLRVPLTLISMHVLLVRSSGRVYGVPSSTLERVLFSDAGALGGDAAQPVFTIDEREYQVCALADLTGRAPEPGAVTPRVMPMLLLQADGGPTAVTVDAAVDGRYLVVKSLGMQVPRPAGVIGASILGDGSVAPVLDMRELLRHRVARPAALAGGGVCDAVPEESIAPEVLIVDDSLTARRMLSMALADAGYRVRTAIDGLDAVEAIEDGLPDMVVTDLEMPRMNGLELAAHLRADSRAAKLPLLMVTSRSTDKHRSQAQSAGINGFITKPYSNDELVERVAGLLQA